LKHITKISVYWEDTDAGGIVYYANYLKFAERARTEMLKSKGFGQRALTEQYGISFVVRRVEVDFLSPARLDDVLNIETVLQECTRTTMSLRQNILKYAEDEQGKLLVSLIVKLVCVDSSMKPTRISDDVIEAL
jgi:acyl-CoA thioester hydrolase